jgi:hypothetical protein
VSDRAINQVGVEMLTGATAPSLRVTDKRFTYVPASHTDIRQRFLAIEQERQRAAIAKAAESELEEAVTHLARIGRKP